jgi:hypothetical protein
MKKNLAIKITLLVLLIAGLVSAMGCGEAVRGGAKVVLEGVSVGSMSLEGKPLQGLPSQKVNVILKVSANEVRVSTQSGETTITLKPSGAKVVIGPAGASFTGVEPDQVEMQWQTNESEE